MKIAVFVPSLCAWNASEWWQTWPGKEPIIVRVCVSFYVSLKQSLPFSVFICLCRWLLQVRLVSLLSSHMHVLLHSLWSAAGFIWFFRSTVTDAGLDLVSHAMPPAHKVLSVCTMFSCICVIRRGGFCGMSLPKPGHKRVRICSLLLLWLWGRSQNTICFSLLNWLCQPVL